MVELHIHDFILLDLTNPRGLQNFPHTWFGSEVDRVQYIQKKTSACGFE